VDPLTHALLGATAAQAALGSRLGRQAWMLGALGGVLPDADILIRSASDPLLAIEYHRHFTHALAFIPVGGIIAVSPWLLQQRHRPDDGARHARVGLRGVPYDFGFGRDGHEGAIEHRPRQRRRPGGREPVEYVAN